MTPRRDINEANIVRQGFASAALEDGATEGQVLAVAADGEGEFVDQEAGPGGSQAVLVEPKTLTAAQLLDLHNTPVEILPAAGGRLYYVVHDVFLHYRFVTAAYNETLTFQLAIGYGSTVGAITDPGVGGIVTPLVNSSDFFQHTADWYLGTAFYEDAAGYAWAAADTENKPVSIAIGFGQSLTGGDSTLTIRTFYSLLDGTP